MVNGGESTGVDRYLEVIQLLHKLLLGIAEMVAIVGPKYVLLQDMGQRGVLQRSKFRNRITILREGSLTAVFNLWHELTRTIETRPETNTSLIGPMDGRVKYEYDL